MSSVFCKKIKNFLENFQKTLQKCKSKYKRVSSFVKKCLKNRGVAVVSRRVGITARRDRSFLLGAKGRGFSFLDFERNKDRVLFYERIRKIFFLLAKGSENDKGGIFRVAPFVNPKTPHTPTNGKRVRGEQPPPYQRGQE